MIAGENPVSRFLYLEIASVCAGSNAGIVGEMAGEGIGRRESGDFGDFGDAVF